MRKNKNYSILLILIGLFISGTGFSGIHIPPTSSLAGHSGTPVEKQEILLYIGTYTSGDSEGIYLLQLDLDSGRLSVPQLAAMTDNPSFLEIHPQGKHLYSVNEISNFEGEKTGAISAFQIDQKTGTLGFLNQVPSGGTGPCFVSIDTKGRFILVANYGGGSVSSIQIRPDGSLGKASSVIQHQGSGINPTRQKKPHAHSIQLDSSQHFAFAADLGLDRIFVYSFSQADGTLTPHSTPYIALPLGSGPRHFSFNSTAPFIYVINELNSTVNVIQNSDFLVFKQIQETSTLPEGIEIRNSTAEILVHPSGQFLYGSNRGHDSIVGYKIDSKAGRLETIGFTSTEGKTPRNFAIDPTGQYLLVANQNSSSIVVFKIDQESGNLKDTGFSAEIPKPVCIRFLESK